MKLIFIPLFLAVSCLSLMEPSTIPISNEFILWRVGQGQMATYVSKTHCHHFDMGGEKFLFPKKKLFQVCGQKKNRVKYSHWDWDHINFTKRVKRILPSLCRAHSEFDLPRRPNKRRLIQKLAPCQILNTPDVKEIPLPEQVKPKNSNESSRIFIVKDKILIPGDSSRRMEKYWAPLIKSPIQVLIAGHHGSKSSTSLFLLKALPQLKLTAASARKKRYGHPHPSIVKRLKQRGILFIQTEHFGHIRIPLAPHRAKPITF